MDHTRGVSSVIEIVWQDAARTLSLKLSGTSRMQRFTTRRFAVHVIGGNATSEFVFDGTPASHRV
jgi:hypothetical protein